MTRQEFNTLSFEEVMTKLSEQYDQITTYDMLKDYAKEKIDSDDLFVAVHILNALWNDPHPDAIWYDYDYCMGTLDTPISLTTKEDVENFIED